MKTKRINRITVYYDDGTYEEINNSLPGQQGHQDKKVVETGPLRHVPVYPYIYPYVSPTTDKAPWEPFFTVTCGTGSVPLKYTIDPRTGNFGIGSETFKSTYNFAPDNKYTITTSGNGNVDISKRNL